MSSYPLGPPIHGATVPVATESLVTAACQTDGLQSVEVCVVHGKEEFPQSKLSKPAGPDVFEAMQQAAIGQEGAVVVRLAFNMKNEDRRVLHFKVFPPQSRNQVAPGAEVASIVSGALAFANDMREAVKQAMEHQNRALQTMIDGYRKVAAVNEKRADAAEQSVEALKKELEELRSDHSQRDQANEVIGGTVAAVLPGLMEKLSAGKVVKNGNGVAVRSGGSAGSNGGGTDGVGGGRGSNVD